MTRRVVMACAAAAVCAVIAGVVAYKVWFAPTRILVVNAGPTRSTEFVVANDSPHIRVDCISSEEFTTLDGYDAAIFFGKSLSLDSAQVAQARKAGMTDGKPVYTYLLRSFTYDVTANVDSGAMALLHEYLDNTCARNLRSALRLIRSIATPLRIGDMSYEPPFSLPRDMYYHLDEGVYFTEVDSLTGYLKAHGLYNERGRKIALINGPVFPVEGSRPHIDSIITGLTARGFNVYPMVSTGKFRQDMLRHLRPDGIIYLPMGRMGDDEFLAWLHDNRIPLFTPFPLNVPRDEWLDPDIAVSAGVLNARVVIPEVDGGIVPVCVATLGKPHGGGLVMTEGVPERVEALIDIVDRHYALRDKSNADKRVTICYFRNPGHDALMASGLEVVPSLYALLRRLETEGYDVSGLPSTLAAFRDEVTRRGVVMGDYAPDQQQRFMDSGDAVWIKARDYNRWFTTTFSAEHRKEVCDRYGKAPGRMMARGDSMAVAMLRYGNVLIFPQPRAAIGDDDFKMVHGAKVAPPHSYLAPYLYAVHGFDTDIFLHFGTHGSLEYTPGKNVGLSGDDWAEAVLGHRPHAYLYTTGNVGEGIIARRRTRAILITHLTPPYVASGMRGRYTRIIEAVHDALSSPDDEEFARKSSAIRPGILALGLHRALGLDSTATGVLTRDDMERVDAYAEEIANEKILGANYTLGQHYTQRDLSVTVEAICADAIAYDRAQADCRAGLITDSQLKDFGYVAHHYLPGAKRTVAGILAGTVPVDSVTADVLRYRDLLMSSPDAEMSALSEIMSGGTVAPAPGGDPVVNPNVLPTGRNMYSVNVEATPTPVSWTKGVALADQTLDRYRAAHGGEWPRKVSYTFWAGEFIASQGATVAQALWMLGVEPVRDSQGRVMDLRLIPSEQLGRPRVDIMVQVSGQLRDIAGSRLKLISDAVRLASESTADIYPNYVREGTEAQSRRLADGGMDPSKAGRLARARVFGPVNSGYSTGMLSYTANSGEWDDRSELAEGYLANMGAIYEDEDTWGVTEAGALAAALERTAVIVQPRQSNTWGPVTLDHVYEFSGALSLAVREVTGREPDAVMADYRNPRIARIQDTKEAVGVEANATVYNPTFVAERMRGDATTAHTFAEIFRNIYGWTVMRQSALDDNVYDRLYDMYVADVYSLGVEEWFDSVNPAAYQEMTGTMLEAARKGYWQAEPERLRDVARHHAAMTEAHGPSGMEFVDGNHSLLDYTASLLDPEEAARFTVAVSLPISDLGAEEGGADGGHDMIAAAVAVAGNSGILLWVVLSMAVAGVLFVVWYRLKSRK